MNFVQVYTSHIESIVCHDVIVAVYKTTSQLLAPLIYICLVTPWLLWYHMSRLIARVCSDVV